MAKKKQPIVVPTDEAARDAVDAINGYIYQLHQSVLAWFRLTQDELLHIEFAEDLAVSADNKLKLVQVKRVAASITMRSEGVAKLLDALWAFQGANPSRTVSAVLLTTSKIGREKGVAFPGKLAGLYYWRVAAREGSDVEPIRSTLLTLNLKPDLKTFIKNASPTEFRDKILRPVRWLDNGPTEEALKRDLEERLVKLGSALGVAAQASIDALDNLVGHLVQTLRKPADQRYVTAADLLTVFQKKTFVSVPPGVLNGLTLPGTNNDLTHLQSSVRDIAAVPMPPRIARRTALVDRLHGILIARGSLWLHGSSGLGKTTLALLVARKQASSWRFADLRDMPPPALRSLLFGIAAHFRQSKARGLILDDVPAEPDNQTMAALDAVARAVADADGVLIVTGTKPPAPTLKGKLNLAKDAVANTPYLDEADVKEIVAAAGGDPKTWGRVIYLFAGGHPQLVDAKVVGLRQRGWNRKEALADIAPIKGVPNDVEEERKSVRSRLLQDLDQGSVELLLRLSLLTGNFTREMALLVANIPPPVQQAGLHFDYLLGPWIEQVGDDRFRLSPLLRDSGTAGGLSADLQNAIKTGVLYHLIVQRPFPADQLLQTFLLAFQLNDKPGLMWFGGAILTASMRQRSQFKRLAEAVSVVTLVDRGENVPLVPDDLQISTMLRFAQLKIAEATEDYSQAAKIVDRALQENALLKEPGRQYADAMIYSSVLLNPKIPVPAARWVQMLANLTELPVMRESLSKPMVTGESPLSIPRNATPDEFLFVGRASAMKDIASLRELIQALDAAPKPFRDRYLKSASRISHSTSIIVASAWLGEVKRPGFDPRAAASEFEQLGQSVSAQENSDLAVELLCAQAVMLDDYAHDQKAALELLDEAEKRYPTDYRLSRQRQKVFYRSKQHAEALAEFEKFRSRMPKDRLVDRTYVLREAGKSAAEVGEMDKARLFFGEAWEASHQAGQGMQTTTAGLSADCAILDFDSGKIDEALALMKRALEEAESVNAKAGLKEAYLKRILIVALLYMRGKAGDWPVEQQQRVIGMCSDPDPQEWFRNQPQPQPSFVWYELAELEAESSKQQNVLAELRKRTKSGGLLPMETMLASGLVKAAVRSGDVDRFLAELPIYLRAVQEGVRHMRAWGGGDMFKQPVGQLVPLAGADWNDPDVTINARNALMTFLLRLGVDANRTAIEQLRAGLAVEPALQGIAAPIFAAIDEPTDELGDMVVIIGSIVGRMLAGEAMDSRDAFRVNVYSLMLLENSSLTPAIAEPLIGLFEQVWPDILEKRSFSVRAPAANGPLILEALRRGDTPLQRLANLALTTEVAVPIDLGNDLRTRLAKLAAKKEKKKIWDEAENPEAAE